MAKKIKIKREKPEVDTSGPVDVAPSAAAPAATRKAAAPAKAPETPEEIAAYEAQKYQDEVAAGLAERAEQGLDDDFQKRGFELVEWVQHKRGIFLAALGSIVLIGLGYGIYSLTQTANAGDATNDIALALDIRDESVGAADPNDPTAKPPKYADALSRDKAAKDQLAAAISKYNGSGVANLSRIDLGNLALKTGDVATAESAFRDYLKATPSSDPLVFAGHAGLAATLEQKGDLAGAAAALETWIALPDAVDKDGALLSLARVQLANNNAAGAKATLERMLKDFPESPLKGKAEDLLIKAGGTKPEAAAAVTIPGVASPE